jgi:membrane protein DedA with SNARE-associated domain
MSEWVKSTMNAMGYPGIALLMFLENVFPPLPSELIMPLAGFTTAQGRLSFAGVIAAGLVGSLAGALPLYYLGRVVGPERLRRWANRHGKWLLMSGEDIERSQGWFERHGGKAVLFCRLVPGVRSLISVPAGVAGMGLAKFLLYSAVGVGLWAGLLAYAGRLLRENYAQVHDYLGPVAYVVLGGLIVLAVGRMWWQKRRGRR